MRASASIVLDHTPREQGDAMPLLDILAEADKILEDPAWIMFVLAGAIGLLGLIALALLYPISRD
jgi:hypothetical protein